MSPCFFSDEHEVYAIKEDQETVNNPGAVSLYRKEEEIPQSFSNPSVVASVTLLDVMKYGESQTYILKLDINGFDCQVLHRFSILLYPFNFFRSYHWMIFLSSFIFPSSSLNGG